MGPEIGHLGSSSHTELQQVEASLALAAAFVGLEPIPDHSALAPILQETRSHPPVGSLALERMQQPSPVATGLPTSALLIQPWYPLAVLGRARRGLTRQPSKVVTDFRQLSLAVELAALNLAAA